jgi:hypothetical protein
VLASFYYFLVEVVLTKDIALGWATKNFLVNLDFFSVIPGSQVNVSIIKVVQCYIGHKTRLYSFIGKGLPVEVCEPRVVLHLVESVDS